MIDDNNDLQTAKFNLGTASSKPTTSYYIQCRLQYLIDNMGIFVPNDYHDKRLRLYKYL